MLDTLKAFDTRVVHSANRKKVSRQWKSSCLCSIDLFNSDVIFGCEFMLDHDVPTQASFPRGYTIYWKESLAEVAFSWPLNRRYYPLKWLYLTPRLRKTNPYESLYISHKQKNYIFALSTNRHLFLLHVLISLHRQCQKYTCQTKNSTHIQSLLVTSTSVIKLEIWSTQSYKSCHSKWHKLDTTGLN